jgi:uncharacterized protein YfaS (alpha-2-macroglobulin family)
MIWRKPVKTAPKACWTAVKTAWSCTRRIRPTAFSRQADAAQQQLELSSQPFVEALLLSLQGFDQARATALLERVLPQQSTLERALALTWLQRSIEQAAPAVALAPGEGWAAKQGATGET